MFYVKKWTSEKTGKTVVALFADLGYRQAIVSFDTMLLCDLLGISGSELHQMNNGTYQIRGKGGDD